MNFSETCHHALTAVVRGTKRLGDHKLSEAEDVFFTTAHQRLEESARMLTAIRHAALAENEGAPGEPAAGVVLSLRGYPLIPNPGTPGTVALHGPLSESHDVTHAA